MKLTKNFELKEFTSSPTAKKYNIQNLPPKLVIENLKSLCEYILQPIRDKVGKAVKINSGYRCLELNKKVGGVPTSQHVMGCACDFRVDDMTPYEIASIVLELGLPYDQIILYPTFVHISYSDRCRRQLLYNKSYKGKVFD